nr:PDZ domain-containing protein [Bacteroidales bacterium]
RFDGLLGFDLVARGLSFKFDTKDSLMIVTDRKGFFAKEERGQPKVKYKAVNKTKPMIWVKTPLARIKMLFDTGAIGMWIDIPEDLILRWTKDDKKMQQALDTLTAWIDTTTLSSAGLYGLAYDTVTRRMIHYPEIEVGDLRLLDLWESTDCNLLKMGSGVMKHASLIIDGPKKRFVFIPHDGTPNIVVDNENKMGLELKTTAPDDPLGVMKADVYKGGQAYEKGLRTGDYLVSIDGKPIESFCDIVAVRDRKKTQHYVFRSPEGTIKEIDW